MVLRNGSIKSRDRRWLVGDNMVECSSIIIERGMTDAVSLIAMVANR